jgi:LacI family gluconate utilization system Gnt-I transcriptional repressor
VPLDTKQRAAAGPPTMADVAEKAGVSAMTVSRAFRKESAVSDETRRRIMEAVEELGYVLDQTAGTLSTKRSGFIAAIIPSINNSNFSDTARGLTDSVESSGLQLLLGYSDYMVEKEERLIESMLTRRPEGLVVTGGRHTARAIRLLRSAGIPIIETWDLPSEPIKHVVGFSNAAATGTLVQELYEQGYRNLAYIGGTSNRDTRGADRRRGFMEAMAALGLGGSRTISFGVPPISMQQGGEAVVRLMKEWPDTDAVICVSDLSAFGAIMECHRQNWSVPSRIAVAGFGDFEIARCCCPTITTVGVDAYGIGHAAGSLMLEAILAQRSGGTMEPRLVPVRFTTYHRESTTPKERA